MVLVSMVNKELKMLMEVEGMFFEMGVSIGVVLYLEYGDFSYVLLCCVDVVMYYVKIYGEICSFYSNELDFYSICRLIMLVDLGVVICEN